MIEELFGSSRDLSILQMADRAVVVFLLALIFIRIAGIRAFGMKSAFDNIIILLLGAILSRVVVGASEAVSTTIACFVIVFLHRLFGLLSVYSTKFGYLVKGKRVLLYQDGKLMKRNMNLNMISEHDLMEGVRLQGHVDDLRDIKEVYLERNGHISIIKK
ncbi:MAG TPA: YetF domain-containing protein [Candidatus Kapabacteria bacterium]|nr:YetF domain-containing protein [Candidatus Kapabacteria bacterium]